MASFNKFDTFVEKLAEKGHNLGSDTLQVYLTNAAPSASGDFVKTDLAEISTGNGYTGPITLTVTSSAQSSGTYTLTVSNNPAWTGSGAGFGPFQYAVLWNSTADALIGWWNYGSSVSCLAGETFTVDITDNMLTLV